MNFQELIITQNTNIFIEENPLENVVTQMAAMSLNLSAGTPIRTGPELEEFMFVTL